MAGLNTRVAKWDNTKAFLIFCVVVGHGLSSITDTNTIAKLLSLWLYFFHMPLFMFLTGLFSKNSINAEKFRWYKPLSFMLLGIFIKFTIYLIKLFFKGSATYSLYSDNGTQWYIMVTSVFFVITYLLRNFNHKKILFISLALALLVGYVDDIGDTLILSRIFTFFPYFYLGYIFDRNKLLSFINKKTVRISSAAVMVIFTLVVFMYGNEFYNIRYALTGNNPYCEFGKGLYTFGPLIRLACYLICAVISLSVLSIMPVRKVPLLTYVGSKTLTVYSLHRQLLYIFQYTLLSTVEASMPSNGVFALIIILSLAITLLLSLKPFEYVIWPCTNCHKWLEPIGKWLKK